jgi:UDP-glucose 4-epimerase
MNEMDLVRLNFNPQSLWALNFIIGLVMFGVALDLKVSDFKAVLVMPKPVLIGLAGQFVLLPAFTFLLVLAIGPAPSVALGMMLVAACPGGNISNFLTHYARGNTALSITMTAVSTAVAIVMTPFNLSLWGGLNPETAKILKIVSLDPLDMLLAVFLLLGLPMITGHVGRPSLPEFRRARAQAGEDLLPRGVRLLRHRRAGGELAVLPGLRRLRGVRRVPAQRAGALHRLFRGEGSRTARARPPRGVHRGRHPELRPGPDPHLQFLRRARRHGHRHGLVGHLAHHFRPDRGDTVVAPSAGPGCMTGPSVLVTGAGGYLGTQLIAALAAGRAKVSRVVAADVREVPPEKRLPGIDYVQADVRSPGLIALFDRYRVDTVVHLASIVTPGKDSNRQFEYSVDVQGTENVLIACTTTGVKKIVVSSSGAAYGYHPDNPAWITEDWPVRGNRAFAYSWHKHLVEEMLARWRAEHPELQQVVFRIGTILGETVKNQITDLFEKPRLLAIRGSDSPFVFIWDQDVVGCLLRAVETDKTGIYNVAGDGALTIHEIAAKLGKPCLALPPGLLRFALRLLKALGLTQYGPEQLDFLRYRPVLDNARLKREFGYVPQLTSTQVFDHYLKSHRHGA